MKHLLLIPCPRRIKYLGGVHPLKKDRLILVAGLSSREGLFIGQWFRKTLAEQTGLNWDIVRYAPQEKEVALSIRMDKTLKTRSQGYQLLIKPDKIELVAVDAAGSFYGICTLIQILKQSQRSLPCLRIDDYPDFKARGIMLDISRSKVPQMATLYKLVDLLASWKINQLQLYTEHTFAYRAYPEVWQTASPMTGQEIVQLDTYCQDRYMELVPNQNSFGHFQRWLKHERFSALADAPGGTTLCPTDPRSIKLLRKMYDELLPHFESRLFNVGCDETSLGKGRSRDLCQEKGEGWIYLDFLLKIYRLVKAHNRTMMFWGDIIISHPELVKKLPKDIIALEWGYGAGHPFAKNSKLFAEAGVPFYVCPGTSSWNSVAGRTDNCVGNLINAAENGLKFGAQGYLNTDWGDNGHWQYLPVSYLGFGVGAAISWCLRTNRKMKLQEVLSLYAFQDASGHMGKLVYDLGNAGKAIGKHTGNSSVLVRILFASFDNRSVLKGIKPNGLNKALRHIEKAMSHLGQSRMKCADAALIKQEFRNAAALLRHGCKRGMAMSQLTKGQRKGTLLKGLAKDMKKIIKEHRRLWLARNRPGGLDESVAGMKRCLREYASY